MVSAHTSKAPITWLKNMSLHSKGSRPQAVFTALHGMQTRSSDEKAICPFVCQTRELRQNGRKICQDFYTTRKIIQPSFLRRKMVGGGNPFYLKFWVNRPRGSKIADFHPIFARSSSAVTSSEKGSTNTNRKSTTRFPMSLS